MSIPTFEQLLDWHEGRLSADEARQIEAWLASAGDESTEVALGNEALDNEALDNARWLSEFFDATQNLRSADPPASAVRRLEERFADFARQRSTSFRKRFVAALSFDSYQTAAAGARSGRSREQRQYLFETEHATLAFTLQRREDSDLYDLLGQVLPSDESEVDLIFVSLLQNDRELDSAITDDLGEFILSAVPGGEYNMILDSLYYEITISSIYLSA